METFPATKENIPNAISGYGGIVTREHQGMTIVVFPNMHSASSFEDTMREFGWVISLSVCNRVTSFTHPVIVVIRH